MSYVKQTWINLPDKTTPISADRLNHMEDGIEGISDDLDNIDERLTDYVKNTDYATSSTGGVIKINGNFGTNKNSNGYLISTTKTYADYGNADNGMFVSKGTLENVILGKQLVNQTYVDEKIGDIGEVLDELQREEI